MRSDAVSTDEIRSRDAYSQSDWYMWCYQPIRMVLVMLAANQTGSRDASSQWEDSVRVTGDWKTYTTRYHAAGGD